MAVADIREVKQGAHYRVGAVGPLEALGTPKVFIGQAMGFTGMEVSLNRIAPGGASPFVHAHRRHEELYLFLAGHGEFQVDGEAFPVEAGTMVRVAPDGRRAWRNTGGEDLVFIVVQANVDSLTGQDGIRFEDPAAWPAGR
jgi:mannose-6-phosphate isomerase-like protein (cupin superfamily)